MTKFKYEWKLSDGYPATGVNQHNSTVFTTFSCGGGSSMGYKLAGYNVIAANDIDPNMQKIYEVNHHPAKYFLNDIRELIDRTDLPDVDLLDSSPPCSVFSMAGYREKGWGVEKKFKEGQKKQTLDDLFFETIKLVDKIRPKVFVGENVMGIIRGNAKKYAHEIVKRLDSLGYTTQVFVLNGADMGLPQRRERVFFIANRLNKTINLQFNEQHVTFSDVSDENDNTENLTDLYKEYWDLASPGKSVGKFKAVRKLDYTKVPNTLVASHVNHHPRFKRTLNNKELFKIGSWPEDYNFLDQKPNYVIGMSVPPMMMAYVADEIYKQLLS